MIINQTNIYRVTSMRNTQVRNIITLLAGVGTGLYAGQHLPEAYY